MNATMRDLIDALRGGITPVGVPEPTVNPVNLQVLPAERPSKKLQAALDWLAAHPGNLDTPSRDLAIEIGVSHMTVHKAQQIMKGTTK